MRGTLESILGGPLFDWSWYKTMLPSSLGGLKMHGAVFHAPAAFLHSSTQSLVMVFKLTSQSFSNSPHTIASVPQLQLLPNVLTGKISAVSF